MLYFNAILFCCVFSHFIIIRSKCESDLLKGILLGSALRDDASEESEILVIRIPRQRDIKNSKISEKTRLTTTTTTTTTTSTTTERPTKTSSSTHNDYDIALDAVIEGVKAMNSTPNSWKNREYSRQTSVTRENICGANQTHTHCFNECGNRCHDWANYRLCPKQHCFGNGCTCATDFVRDTRSDDCIKPSDCPRLLKCPIGERFFVCGGCGPTCERPNPTCPRICRSEGSCDCIQGLVRNIHGKCVPLSLCPLSNSKVDLKTKSKLYPKPNLTKYVSKPKTRNNIAFRHFFDDISDNHYIFE